MRSNRLTHNLLTAMALQEIWVFLKKLILRTDLLFDCAARIAVFGGHIIPRLKEKQRFTTPKPNKKKPLTEYSS